MIVAKVQWLNTHKVYTIPGTVLGSGDTAMTKTNMVSKLRELVIGRKANKNW